MSLQVLYTGSIDFQRTPEVLQLLSMGVIKAVGWANLQAMGNQALSESAIPFHFSLLLLSLGQH